MALEEAIGGEGELFIGEDKTFLLELLNSAQTTPVDMTGWEVLFVVRLKDATADPAIVSENCTIIGAYNSVRGTNTQRASITLTDDQMNLFLVKKYRYAFKRMDDGSETVLAYGDFTPQQATTR